MGFGKVFDELKFEVARSVQATSSSRGSSDEYSSDAASARPRPCPFFERPTWE